MIAKAVRLGGWLTAAPHGSYWMRLQFGFEWQAMRFIDWLGKHGFFEWRRQSTYTVSFRSRPGIVHEDWIYPEG